ncbi:surface protein [Frog virus 3]|uniref:Uncharacterized protein 061L n=2 Tax=Frog virus 3 TaxID=10493 RepID=061L_FRG3G|nr:hypothetical protein FV3gorf61L [Frog virus 3]Q6GZR4.1 RecName: Full=Uncharacterized protein 061L [Frog virus 3 (isolate Goorha)]ASU44210.1 hypothetical protein RCV-Z2_ORF82 [Rana catesbeiana virus 2]WBG67522.1 hypothetical protein [Terrapene mexicana triunguis ranavirus 1]WBY51219.1 hypothetical protein [Terrapene mexicana triunguis ranavirus 2]AAT09721.1 unknown [Frog virus 3]AHM26139.1 hypothetical protein SSMEgorf61L [Frog virus 3]
MWRWSNIYRIGTLSRYYRYAEHSKDTTMSIFSGGVLPNTPSLEKSLYYDAFPYGLTCKNS